MIQDSAYQTLEEAIEGLEIPSGIRENLKLVEVPYISFDDLQHQGQLVIDERLSQDIQTIFAQLLENRFPIEKVIPIENYGWNDGASMKDNNTSAFNYRKIVGTDKLSNHSNGWALDINPRLNPYYAYDGNVYPAGAVYEPDNPGTITAGSFIVDLFTSHGWVWLGERNENKDYQHFEKRL